MLAVRASALAHALIIKAVRNLPTGRSIWLRRCAGRRVTVHTTERSCASATSRSYPHCPWFLAGGRNTQAWRSPSVKHIYRTKAVVQRLHTCGVLASGTPHRCWHGTTAGMA